MEAQEAVVHPNSLRAVAFEVLNQLYGAGPVDDSKITIYQIEAELRHQYGMLLDLDDQKRLKLGQRPDASRTKPVDVVLDENNCLDCDPFLRTGTISEYMSWNGLPYIVSVASCGTKFVPVSAAWQLKNVSDRSGKPTYCIEGSTIKVHMTPRTVAVDSIQITGTLQDPFGGVAQNHPSIWAVAWDVTETYKALAKERAEIRLRGGSVATWQRKDTVNNGSENSVNTLN